MTLGGFFSGGAKGITWPADPQIPGGRTNVTGTIEMVHDPEPVTDPATGIANPDKLQVRIVLATTERDPQDPDDDGRRTLYVRSWMRSAIGEALRKAGAKEPKIGGTLSVTFTHVDPPEKPGINGAKRYTATYTPPPTAAAEHFATANGATPAAAQTLPAAQTAGPAKPASISDAAWAAMDPATRETVAKTMTVDAPPF